jgi:hypothetical protein
MSEVMVEVTVCVTVEVNDESYAEQAVVDLLRMVVLPHPLRLLRVYEPVAITEELIQSVIDEMDWGSDEQQPRA